MAAPNTAIGAEAPDQAVADRFQRVRGALNAGRGVLTRLGYRTVRVFVVTRVWEGGRRSAEGGYEDRAVFRGAVIARATGVGLRAPTVGLEIVPRPKVRFLRTQEVFNSGGIYHDGDVKITYVQPAWTDHAGVQQGYTIADVAPDPSPDDGTETFYYLEGSVQGEYFRVGTITEKFGHLELTLRSRLTTPTKDPAGT